MYIFYSAKDKTEHSCCTNEHCTRESCREHVFNSVSGALLTYGVLIKSCPFVLN